MNKKILFPLFILIIAVSFFVGCAQATDSVTPPVDPPVDPPVETEKDLYFPGFDLIESGSRGMTNFPTGDEEYENCPFLFMETGSDQPFDQIYLSCNAMSALPLLPPFEKKTAKPSEFVEEVSNSSIYIYGFPAKVTKSEINNDGIYMRLVATEGTKNIAMCEYYYCWETETFSYREIVVPFMHTAGFGDNIIAFQMYNVPISESEGKISFNAGVKNGALDEDTAITLFKIHIPVEPGQGTQYFRVEKCNLIMNCQGPKVYATGYKMAKTAAGDDNPVNMLNIHQLFGDTGLHAYLSNAENILEYDYTYNPPNYYLALSDDKSNLEFGYGVMGCLFEDMDKILAADDIGSMEDFNSLSFVYKTDLPEKCSLSGPSSHLIWDLYFSTVFDLSAKKGATTDGMLNDLLQHQTDLSLIRPFVEVFDDYDGLSNLSRFFDILMGQCGLSTAGIAALSANYAPYYVAP